MKIKRSQLSVLFGATVLLVILLVNIWTVSGKVEAGTLTVWVFDIGQGDAIFIDGPERQVLIDGGPGTAILEKLPQVMWPWDLFIDAVIVTHPHADHLAGLVPVLERYGVGQVFTSGQGYGTPEFFAFEYLATEESVLKAGDVIDLGDGATLTAFWPAADYEGETLDDPNDGSVVLLLEYGEMSMLLTGDAGVVEEIAWPLKHVDVLKVGHHGSRTSTGEEFIQAITPDMAVISVGENNGYGLPDEDVLARLSGLGAIIYRTDVHGDVRIRTNGGEPEVRLFDI